MTTFKHVFIYGLYDPRTDEIRYVGKTKNLAGRLDRHIRDSVCVSYPNHKVSWINQLIKLGLKPKIVVIREVLEENWVEAEIYWISYFRSIGARLTNLDKGGRGGNPLTKETIEKIKISRKRTSEKYLKLYGTADKPETIKRRTESLRLHVKKCRQMYGKGSSPAHALSSKIKQAERKAATELKFSAISDNEWSKLNNHQIALKVKLTSGHVAQFRHVNGKPWCLFKARPGSVYLFLDKEKWINKFSCQKLNEYSNDDWIKYNIAEISKLSGINARYVGTYKKLFDKPKSDKLARRKNLALLRLKSMSSINV